MVLLFEGETVDRMADPADDGAETVADSDVVVVVVVDVVAGVGVAVRSRFPCSDPLEGAELDSSVVESPVSRENGEHGGVACGNGKLVLQHTPTKIPNAS